MAAATGRVQTQRAAEQRAPWEPDGDAVGEAVEAGRHALDALGDERRCSA